MVRPADADQGTVIAIAKDQERVKFLLGDEILAEETAVPRRIVNLPVK